MSADRRRLEHQYTWYDFDQTGVSSVFRVFTFHQVNTLLLQTDIQFCIRCRVTDG